MTIVIKNGNVVLENAVKVADILIQDGIIKSIGTVNEQTVRRADRVIDASGKHIFNGFVDLHVHFREPGLEYKEDIASGARAASAGGFVAVCAMPNTLPVVDNPYLVKYVAQRGKEVGGCRVYPIGCITKGSKGLELAEMAKMAEEGAIGFSDDGFPVDSGGVMRTALQYAKTHDLLIMSHSEDRTLSAGGVANEGLNATIAGLKGIPNVAEESAIARDILLARHEGARLHICHVSTKGSVDIIREAKRHGASISAETCPHYFALTDSEILSYNTNAKINPPLRTEEDRLAVIGGLVDGTIDVIATDHAPHSYDDKFKEFDLASFGSTGLETAFAVSYTTLVKGKYMGLARLSRLMSANANAILRQGSKGIIKGEQADLTIVDLNVTYTVDASKHVGKAKNCVFNGKEVSGMVDCTIERGKIIFERG